MKEITPDNRGHVLAEGEATGHAHTIREVHKAKMYEDGNVKFLQTYEPCTVTHQEHKPITIETIGEHTIGIVREYDAFAEEARKVQD